jgi:hypothetical protein
MSHWGFVIEQLTHEDERAREERRRHTRRKAARVARRRSLPRAGDGLPDGR